MSQSLHITGAQVYDGYEQLSQRDLFIKDGRVVDDRPHDAVTINLEGHTIFPAFINAHDHLELNHYPRTKFRDVYDNAHQWGEDVNARLNDEPFKSLRAYPLWDKLFIGGIKNLLCGATTVIHHGAPHKPMFRKDFPVRVLRQYGWAHSLHFNTEDEIIKSYQSTPKDVPWFIHLAEGTDEIAQAEYKKLKEMGCIGSKTVIVHGVGMSEDDIVDASQIIQGFVWCPSTNDYLLEQSTMIKKWLKYEIPIALGSDSRLTANGDLLSEVTHAIFTHHTGTNFADQATRIMPQKLFSSSSALPHTNFIVDGSRKRSKIGLVMRDGIPRVGNPDLMAKFDVQTVACTVDGVEKRIHIDLAKQVHRCKLKEVGLKVDDLPSDKRFFFF